ncbi:hypothetical protein E8E14_008145 [Neopestalotiopsis sp. 37M]|nr:hypothetical protein E8E14_008145 [Neopestalotiopsis sp. 37M]
MDDTKGHHDGGTPDHGEGATLAGYLKRIDSQGITSMIQNEKLGWMMQYKTHLPVHVRDSIRNDQDLVLALVYASMQVEQWLKSDSSPLRKLADVEHELDKIDDQLRMMASRIDTYNSYMAETFTFHPLGDREAQKFRQCFHCLAVDLEHRVIRFRGWAPRHRAFEDRRWNRESGPWETSLLANLKTGNVPRTPNEQQVDMDEKGGAF